MLYVTIMSHIHISARNHFLGPLAPFFEPFPPRTGWPLRKLGPCDSARPKKWGFSQAFPIGRNGNGMVYPSKVCFAFFSGENELWKMTFGGCYFRCSPTFSDNKKPWLLPCWWISAWGHHGSWATRFPKASSNVRWSVQWLSAMFRSR